MAKLPSLDEIGKFGIRAEDYARIARLFSALGEVERTARSSRGNMDCRRS